MKILLTVVLLFTCQSSFAADNVSWPSDITDECRPVFLAFKNNDLSFIRSLEKGPNRKLRQPCKPYIGRVINSGYKDDKFYYSCNFLYKTVGAGELALVKKFDQTSKQEEREVCMRHAVKQYTMVFDGSFNAYKYIVDRLISMDLPDQQEILNKLLAKSVVYFSRDPRYTRYLLSEGADPTVPSSSGRSILVEAFWTINDWGSCDTPLALIQKMAPEDFSIPYEKGAPNSMHSLDRRHSTPLMEVSIITPACIKEFSLIAKKASGLNTQDSEGNTALHYLLSELLAGGPHWENVTMLEILLERGAALTIKNNKNVTPDQLRIQLKNDKAKCLDICDKL